MAVHPVKQEAPAAWKERYLAALFEMDKEKLSQRITDAEIAVAQRTRELFQADGDASSGTQLRERKALEAALYALRALRSISQSDRAPASLGHERPQVAA
jgi:hypothetical protein